MSSPQVPPEKLAEALREEAEAYARAVMQAVNQAPDGEWIAGSEEEVRDLSAEFRRRAFERAMQLRINAAEAAFPPSAQCDDGQAAGQ
jgi:hypothetical protein